MTLFDGNWILTFVLHAPQRACVPLFFTISSYFFWGGVLRASSSEQTKKAWKTLWHWFQMYLSWSVVHFAVIVFVYWYSGQLSWAAIQFYLVYNILRAKFGVLWYLYALVGGNLVGWLLYKITPKLMLGMAGFVTVAMILGDTYFYALPQQGFLATWINQYYSLAVTFRTPFFIGLSLSAVGYVIATHEDTPIRYLKIKTITVVIAFLLEVTVTRALNWPREYSWYLLTMPLAYYGVQFIRFQEYPNVKMETCRYCRKISGLIYFIHMPILQCFTYMFSFIPASATGSTLGPTIMCMVFVTLISIELSNILLRLSEYRPFYFLNKII